MGNICGGAGAARETISDEDRKYFYGQKRNSRIHKMKIHRKESIQLHDNENIGLENITRANIRDRYKFEKTLGEGAFGKVKVASLIQNPSKKFAIKSIPRSLIQRKIEEKKTTSVLSN